MGLKTLSIIAYPSICSKFCNPNYAAAQDIIYNCYYIEPRCSMIMIPIAMILWKGLRKKGYRKIKVLFWAYSVTKPITYWDLLTEPISFSKYEPWTPKLQSSDIVLAFNISQPHTLPVIWSRKQALSSVLQCDGLEFSLNFILKWKLRYIFTSAGLQTFAYLKEH
jgi:hypothetical protein